MEQSQELNSKFPVPPGMHNQSELHSKFQAILGDKERKIQCLKKGKTKKDYEHCKVPCGFWEQGLSTLQEQLALLATEPSL